MGLSPSPEQPEMHALPVAANTDKAVAEVSLLDVLILLNRRRKFILLSAASCTALAVLLGFLLPVSFTATTTFLPPQQASSSASALLSQLGSLSSLAGLGGGGSLKSPIDLYIALMKSETVEDSMVQRFGLMREYHAKGPSAARKAFEQHTKIDGSGKDGLIHVSVDDHDSRRAAELANGYIEQYRQLSANLAISEASQRRLFFEGQLEAAKDKLARAEEAMKQTEQTSGVIQPDSQARALIESAVVLRQQIVSKEVQVSSLKTHAGDGNVELQEAEHELASMRAQLAKLAGNGSDGAAGLMVSKGAIPQAGLDYLRKERDVKYNETLFEILARQYEAAKLDEAKEGSLIQVIDVAKPPERKSFPHITYFFLGGLLLGLFGSCGWVLAKEATDYLRKTPPYAEKLKSL